MPALSPSEQRTVRFGIICVGAYLVLFLVWKLSAPLQKRSADYEQLLSKSRDLEQQLTPYETRVLVTKKLMDHYQMDPNKLNRATVIGQASEEIQKTAASTGIQVGPIRESSAKSATKEMATLQFEGAGPIPGVLGLIKRIETLGYPLVIDSLQVTPNPMRPDQIKLTMTVVILDFEQWKTEGKTHA